jgi:hypothetical protein
LRARSLAWIRALNSCASLRSRRSWVQIPPGPHSQNTSSFGILICHYYIAFWRRTRLDTLGIFSKRQDYGIKSVTLDGIKVKSKAEKTIADYFVRNKIQYQYEKPAVRRALWIFKIRISKPDFYLPRYDTFVEYWGLLNADDKRLRYHYSRIRRQKITKYQKFKIKFISLYPSDLPNLDRVLREKLNLSTGAF